MKTITAFVVRAVGFCAQYAWPVIALSVLLAVASSWYAATHFKMTTDINQLISPNIPWRQREALFEKAFPQYELIIAVIDAPTPELVEAASAAVAQRLAQEKDLIHSVQQPKGGSFFAQNGLLFEPVDDLGPQMNMLTQAQRLVQVLAADPSLRGVIQVLQFGLLGAQGGQITLDSMTWPLNLGAAAIEKVNAGQPASFSWHELVQGRASAPGDLLRFLEIQATLDYSELEPGQRATDAIRKTAADLDIAAKYHARLRLTGPVPSAAQIGQHHGADVLGGEIFPGLEKLDLGPALFGEPQIDASRREIHQLSRMIHGQIVVRLRSELRQALLVLEIDPARRAHRRSRAARRDSAR